MTIAKVFIWQVIAQLRNKMKLTSTQIAQLDILVRQNKAKYPNWRLGQNYFNSLFQIAPEIANEVRGTENDCFHHDGLIEKFLNAIC